MLRLLSDSSRIHSMSIFGKIFGGRPDPNVAHVDIDGQIEALLTNRAYHYASSRLPADEMTGQFYRKVFTVRRRDIEEYLNRNQIKPEEYGEKYHWLSLHQEGDKWIVRQFMPPEKGPGYDHDILHNSYEKASAVLLDKLLMNAGTGIRFSK
jgi:hypothetical protein